MTGAGTPAQPGTIYLVNQFSRLGHLDLYARLYSACALELGYRVVLVAERESGVRAWLDAHHPAVVGRFAFYSRESLTGASDAPPGFWGRVSHAWRRQGLAGIARRVGPSVASRTLGLARRIPGASRLLPARVGRTNGMSFDPLVDEILAAEQASGWPVTLVFFLYLDMMNEDGQGIRTLDDRLRRPWSGILFHPRFDGTEGSPEPERYFAARTSRGAAFLNPHRIPPYTKRFAGRLFGLVPDVTEATLSPQKPPRVAEFERRANGRTVVALVGSLGADKGLAEFLRLIERADPKRFFFVLAGQIFWTSLGADEPRLRRFVAEPPENCFVHVGYLDDERELNSIIAASDILYAVYPNQRDSANSLTKASMLERPLVVNAAYLMGERVRDNKLGAAVPYGDVEQALRALEELRDRPRSSFGFAEFRAAHSVDALRAALGDHLTRWIGAP